MPKHDHVSLSVIRRLPRYFRFLGDLVKNGTTRISSRELSQRMGLTASQIRQDLNCFGGFGQQGYGYNTSMLRSEVGSILGIEKEYPAIIVGAGNIGHAIALNIDFSNMGFKLIGIFDKSPDIVGKTLKDVEILDISHLEEFCKKQQPVIAVLTLPRIAAPEVAERLVGLGVKGFWNFSHYDLAVKYPDIVVENVHLGDSLMTLCYMIKEKTEDSNE